MLQSLRAVFLGLIMLLVPSAPPVQADSPQNGSVVPYLAVGGVHSGVHLETLLFLSNPSRASNSGVISVFDEEVQPLPIALNGDGGLLKEFAWTVPAGGSAQFRLTRPGEFVRSGWMRVKPSENADVDLIVVLRVYDGETLVSQDAFLLPSRRNRPLPFSIASWPAGSPGLPGVSRECGRNPGLREGWMPVRGRGLLPVEAGRNRA